MAKKWIPKKGDDRDEHSQDMRATGGESFDLQALTRALLESALNAIMDEQADMACEISNISSYCKSSLSGLSKHRLPPDVHCDMSAQQQPLTTWKRTPHGSTRLSKPADAVINRISA